MNRFLYKVVCIFVLSVVLPQTVLGAELLLGDGKPLAIGARQQLQVDFYLSAEHGENLNAAEGIVHYPDQLLELREIRDGNSIINFWIERPRAGTDGEIRFAGITPGGYRGSKGLVFSMIFWAKTVGMGIIEIREPQILLNDGKGTSVKVKTAPARVTVSREGSAIQPIAEKEKDTDLPEAFVPEIARDPNIFDGKYFVVFVTQDKGSGIDHYEIRESRQNIFIFFSKWERAGSPSAVQDQELRSYVWVKAVDKTGNIRIEKIQPHRPLIWYENYEIWVILVLAVAAVYFIRKIAWRR